MKTTVLKQSIQINGHKTSVTLEAEFWDGLKEVAQSKGLPVQDYVAEVDKARSQTNLSSALRLAILAYYQGQVAR
jgi:predicted DNA-binding ribbon-helix-helix protein